MDERASRRVTTLASHLACGDRANVHRNPTAGFAPRFGDLFKRDAIDAPKGSVVLAPDVADALRRGLPVVALESTIISHGMPYPDNLTMAREVEAIVREHGATPATIAIIDGVPRVGLTDDQLVQLASLGPSALKVSRRDVAHCIAKGATGATTVSATMLLAHAAGISIFVTGGVGGVHREGHNTLDVSADLTELGRTPVCVVCAGAKSVLDIPRTLEYLETQGVCVAGFGVDEFPAFFTRKSGVKRAVSGGHAARGGRGGQGWAGDGFGRDGPRGSHPGGARGGRRELGAGDRAGAGGGEREGNIGKRVYSVFVKTDPGAHGG
jgi:pseudouridine-5'-phosphate glycosidase